MSTSRRRSLLFTVGAAALILSACGSTDDGASSQETSPTSDSVADSEPTTDSATDTAAAATAECPPIEGADIQTQSFDGPPPMCLDPDASYSAIITTNKGEFTIELDPEQAPETTNNFVFLARNQYFDNTVCHRIIPGFVVQCGDPTATGTGGPGYTIIDEPPTQGEYQIGSIAMANTGAPDSGGSQFFIITGEAGAALPPQYSLFGEIIDGFEETVVSMEAAGTTTGDPSEPIEIQSVVIVQS